MVATQLDDNRDTGRFLVRPNCSLSWRGTLRFYTGMVVVTLGIAIAFAMKGAWLILPFAGLEMLVLGIALYIVARRNASWQSISVNEDSVEVVEFGLKAGQQQSFQRAWASVVQECPRIKGHPSRLLIRSHGRSLEVGACLGESEKAYLALNLGQVIRHAHRLKRPGAHSECAEVT